MNWEEIGVTFIVVLMAAFFGIGLYEWVKAERDERQWRKLLAEQEDAGVPTHMYRLIRDERSDRE